MFAVINTFTNNTLISRHDSVFAALRAQQSVARGVRRSNGSGAYLPTTIVSASADDFADAREVIVECDYDGDYESHTLGDEIDVYVAS